jgi:hypothetical protein
MRGDIVTKDVQVVRIKNHNYTIKNSSEPYSLYIPVVDVMIENQVRTIPLLHAYKLVPELVERFLEVNKDNLENSKEIMEALRLQSPKTQSRKFQVRVSGPAKVHDTDEDSEEEWYRVPDYRQISIYDYKDISVLL